MAAGECRNRVPMLAQTSPYALAQAQVGMKERRRVIVEVPANVVAMTSDLKEAS